MTRVLGPERWPSPLSPCLTCDGPHLLQENKTAPEAPDENGGRVGSLEVKPKTGPGPGPGGSGFSSARFCPAGIPGHWWEHSFALLSPSGVWPRQTHDVTAEERRPALGPEREERV